MILNKKLFHIKGYFRTLIDVIVLMVRKGLDREYLMLEKKSESNSDCGNLRGKHYLLITKEGRVHCDGCGICMRKCPANCIDIKHASGKSKRGEPPEDFLIDLKKCIFCGVCVSVCPIDAIQHSSEYIMVGNPNDDWVLDKRKLTYRESLNQGKGITIPVRS